jgi:hypothetical protein
MVLIAGIVVLFVMAVAAAVYVVGGSGATVVKDKEGDKIVVINKWADGDYYGTINGKDFTYNADANFLDCADCSFDEQVHIAGFLKVPVEGF